MRPHRKKLLYVPDNDVYDYESDGADEEIGVISRGGRRRKYHYDDSRNSLSTRIFQFLSLNFVLIVIYAAICPNNGILGIEFKGSFCHIVVKGFQSIKRFAVEVITVKGESETGSINTSEVKENEIAGTDDDDVSDPECVPEEDNVVPNENEVVDPPIK
jgi:YD repeat-containing protein